MAEARYFQALLPSSDKVSHVEFHPTLPWVACFDRNDYLTVWDWQKHEVIMECQLGSSTQLNRQEVELHSRSEADVNFFGRQLAEYVAQNYTIGQATGKIRSLAFVDLDSIYWKASMQTVHTQGPAALAPRVGHLSFLADRRYIMVVAERAVILMDLLSKRVRTIPSSLAALGGKTFTNAEFLLRDPTGAVLASPMVAIASSDNVIRVVDAFRLTVHHMLVSGPTAPVSAMAVIPCATAGGDWLVVGDEKGGVAIWRPLSGPETSPPQIAFSIAKDPVLSILYVPWVDEKSGELMPRLVFLTGDNRITAYDVKTMTCVYKVKVLDKSKFRVTGACVAAGAVTSDRRARSIIVSTNTPTVFAFSPQDCKAPAAIHCLEAALPARTDKKEAKVYAIASHPLRPDVIAAATNAGVAIMRTRQHRRFPACALSAVVSFKQAAAAEEGLLIAPSSPTIGAGDSPEAKALALSFVILSNGQLEGCTYKAHVEEGSPLQGPKPTAKMKASVNDAPMPILLASRHVLATVGEGAGEVKVNAAGNLVAVCWQSAQVTAKGAPMPDVGRYKVFACDLSAGGPAISWQVVDEGLGSQVEWHHSRNLLAVLVRPPPPDIPPQATKSKLSKEAALKQAMQEAAALRIAALRDAYVTVREILFRPSGVTSVQQLSKVGCTAEAAVVGIHGGPLLGIARARVGGQDAEEVVAHTLDLCDWASGISTDIRVPEPVLLSYAPSLEYAALVYVEGVDIYAIGTTFRHLTRIGIRGVTSAVWNALQLFTTTDSALFVTFVVPPVQTGQLTQQTNLFAQAGGDALPELSSVPSAITTKLTTIELATLAVGSAREFKKFGSTATELPPLSIRPGNGAKLLRATDAAAWLVTSQGHPCAISLQHAGIQCRQLASGGALKAARRLAQRSLAQHYHDGLALFFAAFGQDGVSESLLLPGLSLELELALAVKCGALKRGWACLASLLAGCKDRTLLSKSWAWNHRDVPPERVSGRLPKEGDPSDPFSVGGVPLPGAEGQKLGLNTVQIEKVLAVFTQAAGISAPAILARFIPTGIQGRATALDEDFFSSAPEGDSPKRVANIKAPPPSAKYKPMFPKAVPEDEAPAATITDVQADPIDWNMPLWNARPAGGEAPAEADSAADGAAAADPAAAAEPGAEGPVSQQPVTAIGANAAPEARVLELGISLLDASVSHADVGMLQQVIQLMAPHTGIMTPAQQQRMVAAVGACGLASHLSDLTLSGTTPLMPATALLGGFLSGDALVTARVLEKEGLLPLKALFMQSCGAGGLEASVEWDQHLQNLLGGPTRELRITPLMS